MEAAGRTMLAGSDRAEPAGHQPAGAVNPDEVTTVTVYVRPRPDNPGATWIDEMAEQPLEDQRRMSREEYSAAYGASPTDIEAVRAFADEYGLAVGSIEAGRRTVELIGRVGSLANAFGANLSLYQDPGGAVYRGRTGPLTVPQNLAGVITGVFGLDERPQAQAQFRAAQAPGVQYRPNRVAQLYDFPAGLDGTGQCVGIIELGGGYRPEDLKTYFAQLGIPQPRVTAVSVDGGSNSPGVPSGPDGEVMLDIEVVGAVAPGARIAVYFAPNTDQGFIDAVSTAVHDTTNQPSVVSISWGGPENTWTTQAMNQMEQVFAAAAAVGVTVTAAAGDNGSTDGQADGQQHVDFPSSGPHALGCGGTSLSANGVITSETVWNHMATGHGATGGGISNAFALPGYQTQASVPVSANPGGHVGRGVPDVSGDADPETGYTILVDGQTTVIGGTSAVAPLWAGLIALLNQSLGKTVGFLHPALYSSPVASSLRDITSGSNGAYQANVGWDACTGLGSPDGAKLLAALRSAAGP